MKQFHLHLSGIWTHRGPSETGFLGNQVSDGGRDAHLEGFVMCLAVGTGSWLDLSWDSQPAHLLETFHVARASS